jgi:uncharacterized protein HemX
MKITMEEQGQATIRIKLQSAAKAQREEVFNEALIKVQYWINSWYMKKQYLLTSKYSTTAI